MNILEGVWSPLFCFGAKDLQALSLLFFLWCISTVSLCAFHSLSFFFPIFWIEFLFSFLLFLIPSATSYCSFGSNSLQLFLEITQRTCLQCRRSKFDPWVGTIPWRREWQPTSVFLPREYHGQKSLVGNSPRGPKESDTTEQLTHPHVNMLT